MAGCASSTRGIFAGGYTSSSLDVIQYVTILTTGNATDFGDLSVARSFINPLSNSVTGIFAGGNSPSQTNVMDFITISSTGNATDFGDLIFNTGSQPGGLSNGHGGLVGG